MHLTDVMQETITLFVVPTMEEDNQQALKRLEELGLPDSQIEVLQVPPSMPEQYPCPFVKDEMGRGYYGLKNIEVFVDLRKQNDSRVTGTHRHLHSVR